LILFRKLQPKTFQFKDIVQKGSATMYGFISQEVHDVLPHAAKTTIDTLPNIYTFSPVLSDLLSFDTTLLEYDASGILFSKLKIIQSDNSESFVQILSVLDATTVRIDRNFDCDKVFVYGQEVNNFHTLERDAIWTVSAAALQEVDRQLQAEKQKTATLEQQVQTLQSNYENLLARVLALESK